MFKYLVLAASLGFSISAAQACGLMRSANADETTDTTTVASIGSEAKQPQTTTVEKAAPPLRDNTELQPAEPIAK